MYGLVNVICFPCDEDPQMLSLTLFNSFEEALKNTEIIIEKFIEDYGEDIIEKATQEKPVTIMFNGEVTAYAYIVEVTG